MQSDSDHVPNYYELLGVAVEASFEDVESAYRKIARRYHPDSFRRTKKRNRTDRDNENMFQRISEAKDTLTDKEKRLVYNMETFGHDRSKWIGSEARALEDLFYYDMHTKASKGHKEKCPPIVLRTDITLAEWLARSEPCTIEYERVELCPSCYGYQRVPYDTPNPNSAFRFYRDWEPEEYTIECPLCTGEGFLVKDSSIESKMKKNNVIDHCTPEGYSTTITAEIQACSQCAGRKRIFREDDKRFAIDTCDECNGEGTYYNRKVSEEIPFPRHFDPVTNTTVIVLIEQGHQQRANQIPGDVHVIVELKMPLLCVILKDTPLPQRTNTEIEIGEEEIDEEEGEEHILSIEEDIERVVPMNLKVSKSGQDFTMDCNISLKQAICGFSLRVPCYWEIPTRWRPEYTLESGCKSFETSQGEYTWTGDVWNMKGIGPVRCDLCSMPSFVWPHSSVNGDDRTRMFGTSSREEKLMGKYPGFAPCLFARLQGNARGSHEKDKWVFFGCGVSRQRYPTHPGNTLVSFNRPISHVDDTSKRTTSMGSLRVTFNVMAPESHSENPDMFYRTFAWCCTKLGGCRVPTVRST